MSSYRTILFSLLFILLFSRAYCSNIQVILPEQSKPHVTEPQQGNSIASIHRSLMNGRNTCADIINSYIYRIKKYDLALNRGAPLNAYVTLNPLALQQAAELDNYMRTHSDFKGPLHCVPTIVNDNIDTINTTTTAGSLALLGSQPIEDATVVTQLKQAGAIILGKGSMDELSNTHYGFSSRSGRIGNVYNPNENPGGASGGVAVAVGADLAVIGVSADSNGSIILPSSYNGVIGLRPSASLLDQQGIVPTEKLTNSVGLIARSTSDLAIAMNAITARNTSDTQVQIASSFTKYDKYLSKGYLANKRIGLVRSVGTVQIYDPANTAANEIFQDAAQKLIELQATVIDIQLPKFDTSIINNKAGEIEDINEYLSKFPSTRQNFSDICRSERLVIFNSTARCLNSMNATPKKNSGEYQSVSNKLSNNSDYIQTIMNDNHLDALLIPVDSNGGPSYDTSQVNPIRAPLATNSGLPTINIIVGYTHTSPPMPVAMQFIALASQEPEILGLAYAYEKNSPQRNLPMLGNPRDMPLIKFSSSELNNLFTQLGAASFNKASRKGGQVSAIEFANITKQVIKENVSRNE